MNWYYESAGTQQGPVTDADLDRLLTEGKITLDTLVWREGMSGWTPLRSARPGAATTTPAVAPATGGDAPPPGHIRCTLTGQWFPPSEIFYQDGKPYSAAAKPQLLASLQAGGAAPSADFERNGPAWEQRATLGWVKAAIDTTKAVLLQPAQCFATMRRTGGLGSPLMYLALLGGGGQAVGYIYQMLLQGAMLGFIGQSAGAQSGQIMTQLGMTTGMLIVFMVLSPVLVVLGTFITAGLTHLCLMLLKAANHPFEVTMRVSCYAWGAAYLLNIVPICGAYAGWIWGLVAMCMGLGRAQDCSTEKGVAAVLLPFGICCLGIILIALGFGFFGAMAGAAATRGVSP
jgi:hypothetical protein